MPADDRDLDLGPLTPEAFLTGWYDDPIERAAARREFIAAGLIPPPKRSHRAMPVVCEAQGESQQSRQVAA